MSLSAPAQLGLQHLDPLHEPQHDGERVRVVEREIIAQAPRRARGDDAVGTEMPCRTRGIARRERAAVDQHLQFLFGKA